jgi:hypothetical protein
VSSSSLHSIQLAFDPTHQLNKLNRLNKLNEVTLLHWSHLITHNLLMVINVEESTHLFIASCTQTIL